ncbi:MAG: winged helix DNA-binding protein [Nitrosotalea sp.]
MLVDIPDPGVILGVLASFVIGVAAITIYNKIRPHLDSNANNVKILLERLQNYENLLIDMKIKLDSLEIERESEELSQVQIPKPREQKPQVEVPVQVKEEKPKERVHNMNFGSATEYVLRLITEKHMTSRDIQITIGRTREHTSRMMKKLFEEGLVERDMQTKPFTYKITEKGLGRIRPVNAPTIQ